MRESEGETEREIEREREREREYLEVLSGCGEWSGLDCLQEGENLHRGRETGQNIPTKKERIRQRSGDEKKRKSEKGKKKKRQRTSGGREALEFSPLL